MDVGAIDIAPTNSIERPLLMKAASLDFSSIGFPSIYRNSLVPAMNTSASDSVTG